MRAELNRNDQGERPTRGRRDADAGRRAGAAAPAEETEQPLVSIIVPTYRRDRWLPGAIQSALRQTWRRLEVIVTDSAGSAATQAIVAGFGDPRVRYRRNDRPVDARENHVAGMAEAQGDYVAVLHDDDEWEPRFLECLVGALETRTDCVLAFCDQAVMGPAGVVSREASDIMSRRWGRAGLRAGPHQPFWDILVKQSIPMLMGAVFRRRALDLREVGPEAGTAFDNWIAYLLCRTGAGAYYVADRLIRYRVHPESETFLPTDAREGMIHLWEAVVADPGARACRRAARWRLARSRQVTALTLLQRDPQRAGREAALALRHRPGPRALAVLCLTALPPGFALACVGLWHAYVSDRAPSVRRALLNSRPPSAAAPGEGRRIPPSGATS